MGTHRSTYIGQRIGSSTQNNTILCNQFLPKNLKRILSSSKFEFDPPKPSVKKCGDKRCKACPNLIEGSHITFKNGRKFTVHQDMSYKSQNNMIIGVT